MLTINVPAFEHSALPTAAYTLRELFYDVSCCVIHHVIDVTPGLQGQIEWRRLALGVFKFVRPPIIDRTRPRLSPNFAQKPGLAAPAE